MMTITLKKCVIIFLVFLSKSENEKLFSNKNKVNENKNEMKHDKNKISFEK